MAASPEVAGEDGGPARARSARRPRSPSGAVEHRRALTSTRGGDRAAVVAGWVGSPSRAGRPAVDDRTSTLEPRVEPEHPPSRREPARRLRLVWWVLGPLLVLVATLTTVAAVVHAPYVMFAPGSAVSSEPLISVPEGQSYDTQGRRALHHRLGDPAHLPRGHQGVAPGQRRRLPPPPVLRRPVRRRAQGRERPVDGHLEARRRQGGVRAPGLRGRIRRGDRGARRARLPVGRDPRGRRRGGRHRRRAGDGRRRSCPRSVQAHEPGTPSRSPWSARRRPTQDAHPSATT